MLFLYLDFASFLFSFCCDAKREKKPGGKKREKLANKWTELSGDTPETPCLELSNQMQGSGRSPDCLAEKRVFFFLGSFFLFPSI